MIKDLNYTSMDGSTFVREVLKYGKPVIVEFGAEWCGTCRIMAPILNDIAANHCNQIRVVRLDIDQNQKLAERFGVRATPTFLFIWEGEVVDQIVGATGRDTFEARLNILLSRTDLS